MDRVDAHVHVFTHPSEQVPREVSRLAPAEREATAEQLLREMDAPGIDRAVLIDMGGTEIEQHAYVTDCVRRWPERFTATGLVPATAPDAPARLTALHEATGIEGIRVGGGLGAPGATTAEELPVYPLFARVADLGLNVNVYPRSADVAAVEMLLATFTDTAFSLDHLGVCPSTPLVPDRWGRPRFDDEPVPPATYDQILGLARFPNAYVKVSGEYAFSKVPYPYGDMKPMVERAYEAFGPERMMWCTDFPWIVEEPGYGRLVELIDHHLPDLNAREKEQIMGGNALKIWWRR